MGFIDDIKNRAKLLGKRIVLPEATDERILKAARIARDEGIAEIVLLGNRDNVQRIANNIGISVDDIIIIDPREYEYTEKFIEEMYRMRSNKGLSLEESRDLILNNYMYFACMMVYEGLADGVVSGAIHSSSETLRPALQVIKMAPGSDFVSSFFLMEVPNCDYGEKGVFVFSDCGLMQDVDAQKLAIIANQAAKSFTLLTGKQAIVAMLSYSTKGSASHKDVTMVQEASRLAKEMNASLLIDGELQVDAALDSGVALMKAPNSEVAGRANVLIFPSLDAGNIGYKLVSRLAKANAYGPITQGMLKPINDLSRGATVSDIVGVIAITALQSQK